MNENDLRGLLNEAVRRVDPPDRAEEAISTAEQRRRVRLGGGIAAGVVAALVAVLAVVGVPGNDDIRRDTVQPANPSETEATDDSADVRQPEWDPRTVDELPKVDPEFAPAIPATIDPPASAQQLSDGPIEAAALAVRSGEFVKLLSSGGVWRSVALPPGRGHAYALSPGGSRLAMWPTDTDNQGPTVVDVQTGKRRELDFPQDGAPYHVDSWQFTDENELLLANGGAWLIDATTGQSERFDDLPGQPELLTSDSPGNLVASARSGAPSLLRDYRGRVDDPRLIPMDRTGRLTTPRVTARWAAGFATAEAHVVLADRLTLRPRAILPIRDGATFADGGLTVLGLSEDDSVLMKVAAVGRNTDGFRVVAWNPDTEDLSLVFSDTTARRPGRDVAFASLFLTNPATREPAPIDPTKIQKLWDPTGVLDLRLAGSTLPERVSYQGPANQGTGSPARAAVVEGDSVNLFHYGSIWTTRGYPDTSLSRDVRDIAMKPDGSRVVVTGQEGVWQADTVDFTDDSQWQQTAYPEDAWPVADAFTAPTVQVLDDGSLLLGQYSRWWVLVAGADATDWMRLPFDEFDEVVAAGDSVVAERYAKTGSQTIQTWRDGELVDSQDSAALQSLQRPAANRRSLVTVRASGGYLGAKRDPTERDGLLALRLSDLETEGFLPIPSDRFAHYTDNGGLTPIAWLNPLNVMVGVRLRKDPDTTYVVAWDVRNGGIKRLSSYETRAAVAFATKLL